jgi:hypothetical protein
MLWQYVNRLGGGKRGLLSEAVLLPPAMDAAFFHDVSGACGQTAAAGPASATEE